MPLAAPDVYVEMLDKAKREAFAYPGHQRELVPDAERGLHTDHCPKDKLDGFVRPLLDISIERVKNGQDPTVRVAHVGRVRRTSGRRTSPRSCLRISGRSFALPGL